MAIVSGAACIVAGIVRLGFITELLSKPIRYGYMNGIALAVLISQLPKLFGFSIESDGPLRDLWAIGSGSWTGKANWAAFGAGRRRRSPLIFLLKAQQAPAGRFWSPWSARPSPSALSTFRQRAACQCWARCRRACRSSRSRGIAAADIMPVLIGGCAVAIVSFADTSVLSRTYRGTDADEVDPNQEMVGLGAANLAAGFFQGFPISSSSSRTPVAEAGGREDPADRRRRRARRRACSSSGAEPASRTCPMPRSPPW